MTLRIHSRPGHRSKISEVISVVRFHSVPPTPWPGNSDSGSRTASSSNTERGINGKTAKIRERGVILNADEPYLVQGQ